MQILETHNQVEEKTKIYVPYNILPLDPDSANQAVMQYPEVWSSICGLLIMHCFCHEPFILKICLSCVVSLKVSIDIFCRFKLLFMPSVIPEVYHGRRITRESLTKIFSIGFRLCLDFRCAVGKLFFFSTACVTLFFLG